MPFLPRAAGELAALEKRPLSSGATLPARVTRRGTAWHGTARLGTARHSSAAVADRVARSHAHAGGHVFTGGQTCASTTGTAQHVRYELYARIECPNLKATAFPFPYICDMSDNLRPRQVNRGIPQIPLLATRRSVHRIESKLWHVLFIVQYYTVCAYNYENRKKRKKSLCLDD